LPLLPSSPSARVSVAVVGAGRLGTALALALASCGYELRAVVARRVAHARRAAALAGVPHALALDSAQLELLPPTRLLFITTPDDAVAETAARLAALSPTPTRGRVVLHTSGALSSEVLAPLRERGFRVGSMHPLAPVSEPLSGAERLRGAFFCVEGERAATAAARRVVRDLGGQSFSVRATDKALYHAAAVMTSGHTVALFDTAARLLVRCGLAERRAREVLLPLLRGTLENLSARTPARALTGTFARADVETVRKHLAALVADGDSSALMLYALLGDASLRLAAQRGDADPTDLKEIARALGEAFAEKGKRG
ncbi:MAG TPA: Rossmann-like and DUF2520 domain-containing protein, partial [Pyrinomonadaceae bacterium]|nr:Rossmann-like and DUF2520 domain-containing protein [Pyrinomonadaceae bacterium]